MLLSCKISSSVLSFLEKQGEDLSSILEVTSLPEEFLRDPSYWMQADEMENFLAHAFQLSVRHSEEALFQKIGHMGHELRSWGVLDSVLRMMPKPQEILAQPDRFLSYFISPAPPTANVIRTENSIELDVPISTDQYPHATAFLGASFESLPLYVGQPLASCEWQGIRVKLRWNSDQENFFDGVDLGHTLSPDLMRNVVATLEKHSKDLEEKNRELQAKNEALVQSQKKLEASLRSQGSFVSTPETSPDKVNKVANLAVATAFVTEARDQLQQNLSRLSDYMVRSQQLVTMLIGQGRNNPQIKEAMRRVDWERIQKQFPQTVEESRRILIPSFNEALNETFPNNLNHSTGENSHV